MSRERGRLTLPDLVYVLMSLAVLGALWPVVQSGLEANAGVVGTGPAYIFLLLLPLAALVLLTLIWRTAAGGAT